MKKERKTLSNTNNLLHVSIRGKLLGKLKNKLFFHEKNLQENELK
jgi:hypothetical protein